LGGGGGGGQRQLAVACILHVRVQNGGGRVPLVIACCKSDLCARFSGGKIHCLHKKHQKG
jgi:hypothetical protein